MRTFGIIPLLALVLASAVGCSAGDSLRAATEEIEPRVRVVSSGDATEVSVALFQRGAFGRLQLSEGDALFARLFGGTSVAMTLRDAGSLAERYTAVLPATVAGGEVVIALERTVGEGAPATRVTIPAAPVVLVPGPGARAASGEPFTVAWEPFDDGGVEVRFASLSCPELSADEQAIVDAIVALPGQLVSGMSGTTEITLLPGSDLACEADLIVGRAAMGAIDVDPAFAGLHADSRVVREAPRIPITFEAAP
jgi:hypothetical protein